MAHWKQRETVFGEYELAVTLPGRWQLRPSDDPSRWLYRSAERHKEHVTLTRDEPGGADGGEAALLERWVARQRRGMELAFARSGDLSLDEVQFGERFGVPTAWYRGEAPGADHRIEVLFLYPPRTIWTLVYDAFHMTEEQATSQATAIFDSIAVRRFL